MDVSQLIRCRRSVKNFRDREVPRDVIRSILDLARWAPSAHNAQPWRLLVIDDEEVKAKVATAMGRAWLSDLDRDGVPRDEAERIVRLESWNTITRSPVVVIACLTMEEMHEYPDQRRQNAEYVMGVQSLAAYIQTMLLAAHHRGLGACWICGPLFCPDAVKRVLRLPGELEPQAMVVMGYPAEKPRPPFRKPLHKICAFNKWPKH